MSKDKAPSGFNDEDLERFLVLLDQRALSDLTVKSLVWQFKKQKAKLAECVAALEYIQNDMPKKAKEKFDKNEVTYFCVDADAEVLDPRFEHAILAREVLAKVKK